MRFAETIRNRPLRIALGLAGAAAIGIVALRAEAPKGLGALGRADRAQQEISSDSAKIVEHLEAIASNLEQGAGVSSSSEEIRSLTIEQQRSLEDLADLLREQPDYINSATESLERTRTSVRDLVRLTARQTDALRRAVSALRSLESLAADASALSAELAKQALYGARLAEDSAEAFKP